MVKFVMPTIFKCITLLSITGLSFLLISCHTPQQEPSLNEKTTLITLSPHLTELAISAGAIDHLVGKISFPGDVTSKLKDITIIGDSFKIDYETVLSLNPDYVLSWKGGTPVSMVNKLKSLNLQVIEIKIDKITDIPLAMANIAELTGTELEAQSNIEQFNKQLAILKNQKKTPKSTFIQTYHQPLYTVSALHWMSEAAQVCGFHNIFEDLAVSSAAVSLESVISHNPESIIVLGVDHNWLQWPELQAVKNNNIIVMSPDDFSQPSMRILTGIEKLCDFNK